MNDGIVIRAAHVADVPGIVSVLHDTAAEDRWIGSPPGFDVEERVRQMIAAYNDGRVAGVVADEVGVIVGQAGARLSGERAYLGMAVARAYRGRGIGRALLRAMIAALRERGLRFLDLHVYVHNPAAIALYRTAGFVDAGEIEEDERANGERWPALPMTLEL